MAQRGVLIDVSRLVWRLWRGGPPTGVDRVCLAYVEQFRAKAQAVIQRKGRYLVLAPRDSDWLFELFTLGPQGFRRNFFKLAIHAFPSAKSEGHENTLYLNVGHTGLDEPTLVKWISRNRLRAIYFVHDLIPLLYPEYCRPGEQDKHRSRMNNVLASAHGIIGNSQATIDDLANFARNHGQRTPPAVASWIGGAPFSLPAAKTFGRPHFIIVGTIEGRKNHSLLLHIWKRLVAHRGAETPLLVIAGQRGWEAGEAIAILDRAVDLKGHVLELSKCSDDELAGLIAGARALLMPSFAEGFGLPVSEALQLGTPVIASDLPVFREFAADIPTYIDPLDGVAWERTVFSFTRDSQDWLRQRCAMQHYRAPTWLTHFSLVEEWLESLP